MGTPFDKLLGLQRGESATFGKGLREAAEAVRKNTVAVEENTKATRELLAEMRRARGVVVGEDGVLAKPGRAAGKRDGAEGE